MSEELTPCVKTEQKTWVQRYYANKEQHFHVYKFSWVWLKWALGHLPQHRQGIWGLYLKHFAWLDHCLHKCKVVVSSRAFWVRSASEEIMGRYFKYFQVICRQTQSEYAVIASGSSYYLPVMFLPPTVLPFEYTGDQILKKQMYLLKQKNQIIWLIGPT